MPAAHALLLTGLPGSGKTTVVRRIAERLGGLAIAGFATDEIRERGERLGFLLRTFDGRSAILAHVQARSPHRVGRYGVDLAALEAVVESALALDRHVDVYLVDEIGKMECLSGRFVRAMEALLDSTRPLVATIAQRGAGLIARARRREDVEVWTVTHATRDELPERALGWLAARNIRPRPAG